MPCDERWRDSALTTSDSRLHEGVDNVTARINKHCAQQGAKQSHGTRLRSISATLMVDGLMHGARLRNTCDTTAASMLFHAEGL